jgi:hypothetical protein
VTLKWTGGDPDGDSVSYDVYLRLFPSTSISLLCNDVSYPQCPLFSAARNTVYSWYVESKDEYGAVTEGQVWFLKTEP